MAGERRPSPDKQVREALEAAKREGQPFDEAWRLAVDGQVCDSYTSARGSQAPPPQPELDDAPNLRPSAGQKRCAGCRFVHDAGSAPARCTLYSREVYAGVLWPHRTAERHEWQTVIVDTAPEWAAAYRGEPTALSRFLSMLAARGAEGGAAVYELLAPGDTLAA